MLKITILLKLLPHLIKNWRLTIIGLLLGFVWYLNNATDLIMGMTTIPHIQSQLESTQETLAVSALGNQVLQDTLNNRNAEIIEWQASSQLLETKNNILSDQIRITQTKSINKVKALLKQKTPETCTAAFKLLADTSMELTWND